MEKYCVNCKYFDLVFCTHPKYVKTELNLVTGNNDTLYEKWAYQVRSDENECGEEGKYYEQKTNLLIKFLNWWRKK